MGQSNSASMRVREKAAEMLHMGVSCAATQIPTIKDEDRFLIDMGSRESGNVGMHQGDTLCLGVYDGHGGSGASELLRRQLHKGIIQKSANAFQRSFQENKELPLHISKQTIREEYLAFDEICKEKFDQEGAASLNVFIALSSDGSRHVRCAWAGDCRALGFRGTKPKSLECLSVDHSLDRADEINRILQHGEEHGGAFISRRISADGRPIGQYALFKEPPRFRGVSLTMARSIGDSRCSDAAIAEPDFTDFVVGKNEYARLILASDGLWRVINNKKALKLAQAHKKLSSAETAKRVAIEAYQRTIRKSRSMSLDDITVLVVDINPIPFDAADARKDLHVASTETGSKSLSEKL